MLVSGNGIRDSPDSKTTIKFTVDGAGHGVSLVLSTQPDTVYKRTGEGPHVFHDYERSEVMIPMRDGVSSIQ